MDWIPGLTGFSSHQLISSHGPFFTFFLSYFHFIWLFSFLNGQMKNGAVEKATISYG